MDKGNVFMKRHLAFLAAALLSSAVICPSQSVGQVSGGLDPGFGNGGKVFTAFGPTYSNAAYTVARQPDGKLVVAGGGPTGLQLVRYNPDGTLDVYFGSGGTVTTNLGSSPPSGYYPNGNDNPAFGLSLLIQPADGKIVVAGRRGHQYMLMRYATNGTIDTGFGTNGIVASTITGLGNACRKVMLDSAGRLVVLVAGNSLGGTIGYITRYSQTGAVDNSWNVSLTTTLPVGSGAFTPTTALLDPADNIVVAGLISPFLSQTPVNYHPAVCRILPNGTLDASFGSQGLAVMPGTPSDQALGLARQTDGKLVVSTYFSTLWRIDANGITDVGFGTAGTVSFAPAMAQPVLLTQPLIQPDGKVLAVGSQTTGLANNFSDFAVVRTSGSGVPDAAFGVGGRLIFSEKANDAFYDALLQPDGNLVAAGYTSSTINPRIPMAYSQASTDSSRVAVCRILTRTALATYPQVVTSAKLAVYPNPASGVLRMEATNLPAGRAPIQLQLRNGIGQLVRHITLDYQNGVATATLSLTDLAPGIYWLQEQAVGPDALPGQRIVVK